MQEHRDGSLWSFGEIASVAGREHEDALGAEVDRVRYRRVVRHASVHQHPAFMLNRWEDPGDSGACHDRLEGGPLR